MARNLADPGSIAKGIRAPMSHGQVSTGYPILRNSYTPPMDGVEMDEYPVRLDLSGMKTDGLAASNKRPTSDAGSSSSQQSKLMPNLPAEDEVEFGLTEGTLL